MKKRPDLAVVFGVGKEDKEASEESSSGGYSDDVRQACREFFEAAGLKPGDEDAACEALVALIDLRIGDAEKEEGDEEEEEGEREERAG